MIGSPRAIPPLRHWILTFHDETVEVVAEAACVHRARVEGENTLAIVDSMEA